MVFGGDLKTSQAVPWLLTAMVSPESLQKEIASSITSIDTRSVFSFAQIICRAIARTRTIYIFGNGGSAALAAHLATDLLQISQRNPRRIPISAVALSANPAVITALANDYGFDTVFARQLRSVVREADVAVAISSSGRSKNVLRAVQVARQRGAICVGLTGKMGKQLRSMCHSCFMVLSTVPYVIETVHLCLMHLVFTVVDDELRKGAF